MSARWLPLSDLMDLIRLLHKTSANCLNTLNCPAGPPDCRGDTGNRHPTASLYWGGAVIDRQGSERFQNRSQTRFLLGIMIELFPLIR
jgi:hypothetical protein